ncbi:MAG: hypothetical protein ACLFUB_08400 [Cyclobacteriaceae bacterium]
MKKLLVILTLLFLVTDLAAQCENAFYRLKEGTEFTMTSYNTKDKEEGRTVNLIRSVSEKDGAFEATLFSSIYDKKDKLLSEGDFVVICQDGKLKIDMQRMLASMNQMSAVEGVETEVEGDFMELPSELEVGQSLPDTRTTMTVTVGGSGMASKMNVLLKNRKVAALEDITTPAGTFKCYKITYDTELETKVMGMGRKDGFSSAEWVARNVGVVKTESYDKKGRVNSYTLLTSFKE